MSLDQIAFRSIRARRRFKALVRLVIANRHWLEDVEDEHLSENVKKNVQLLTKKKAKKGLLTLQQKALLNKPAEYRTEEEKILLNKIIGGLKCFRKYPEHVKLQLAGATYFVYYGPQRVIVRQNHIAHALYFIISGEVAVSITTYDPVLKENVTTIVGTMVAGSMFGEVSLLHDIPRTATIVTHTPCELLLLRKADFDIVLKETVKEQWDEIQKAMVQFSYFDGWDDVAVRECCIYSKIKPFIRDQTILVSYDKNGKKRYKIYETEQVQDDQKEEEKVMFLDEAKQSLTSLDAYKGPRGIFPELDRDASHTSQRRLSRRKTRGTVVADASDAYRQGIIDEARKSVYQAQSQSTPTEEQSIFEPPLTMNVAEKDSFSSTDLPDNVETHFMQVCILSEHACFGLGENMKRRRVVAMTDYVECLLIPRYWLFQHNKSNLWSRIQQYLDTQIPSTDTVYKAFLNQRQWISYRRKLTTELYKKGRYSQRYNIPYSIRINEDIHID
ncbi:hypothetical protein Trydic_g14611 [Trypoxylus dichotomus]